MLNIRKQHVVPDFSSEAKTYIFGYVLFFTEYNIKMVCFQNGNLQEQIIMCHFSDHRAIPQKLFILKVDDYLVLWFLPYSIVF